MMKNNKKKTFKSLIVYRKINIVFLIKKKKKLFFLKPIKQRLIFKLLSNIRFS
jgi:hypothetical protein